MILKEFPERAPNGIHSNSLLQWHMQISSSVESRAIFGEVSGVQEGFTFVYLL